MQTDWLCTLAAVLASPHARILAFLHCCILALAAGPPSLSSWPEILECRTCVAAFYCGQIQLQRLQVGDRDQREGRQRRHVDGFQIRPAPGTELEPPVRAPFNWRGRHELLAFLAAMHARTGRQLPRERAERAPQHAMTRGHLCEGRPRSARRTVAALPFCQGARDAARAAGGGGAAPRGGGGGPAPAGWGGGPQGRRPARPQCAAPVRI